MRLDPLVGLTIPDGYAICEEYQLRRLLDAVPAVSREWGRPGTDEPIDELESAKDCFEYVDAAGLRDLLPAQ